MRMWWNCDRSELRVALAAVLAIGIVAPTVAQAQRGGGPSYRQAASAMHWRVATGIGARPDYEGSDDYDPFPLGYFRVWWDDGRYADMAGAESSGSAVRLHGNLVPNSPFEIGPVLQYRLERDDVKSDRVDALGQVDGAVEAGVVAAYRMRPWVLQTTFVHDISAQHEGYLWELGGGYAEELSPNLGVELTVASTYASNDYMDAYFNVSAAESVTTGFDTFNADAGFKDVGGRAVFSWAGDGWGGWKLLGIFSYFRLIDDAEDSPVVDEAGDEDQFFGGLMLAYER